MKREDGVPPAVREVYERVAERYRQRGLAVPPLPSTGIKAQNLIYTMVAKLNNRKPLRVRYDWRNPMVVEDAEERGKRNDHNPRPAG